MTAYDADAYTAAANTFLAEPEALTLEQIETLRAVDAHLGDRAARKRTECLQKAAQARHRKQMGDPPAKVDHMEAIADHLSDLVLVAVARPKHRITQLETRVAQLESQLVDVQAQRVIAEVTADD